MTTTTQRDSKTQVLEIISSHQGWENSIKSMAVAELLGYRDDRKIQQAIEELINDGYVIASSCSNNDVTGQRMGYYIPVTFQQEQDYKHQLRSRALGNFHRYKRFKVACARRREGGTVIKLF